MGTLKGNRGKDKEIAILWGYMRTLYVPSNALNAASYCSSANETIRVNNYTAIAAIVNNVAVFHRIKPDHLENIPWGYIRL